MKNVYKITLFLASIPLVLSACEGIEKKAYFLETSTTFEYIDGKCYQASFDDVLEVIYVINTPINPEADPSEYQFDITFSETINDNYLSLVGGLSGKRIDSVFIIDHNILKVNISNVCQNDKETYGYIKINPRAFVANSKRAEDTFLYAYVAIGESGGVLANKPSINDDGTIAE